MTVGHPFSGVRYVSSLDSQHSHALLDNERCQSNLTQWSLRTEAKRASGASNISMTMAAAVTLFAGPEAERRARDYAVALRAGVIDLVTAGDQLS
jgi:hypothetical protein